MSKRRFALLLAGALMVPHAALGAGSDNFALPPIPYAETIPWLAQAAPPKVEIPKVLLTPGTLEFAGARLELKSSGSSLLLGMVTRPAGLSTSRP